MKNMNLPDIHLDFPEVDFPEDQVTKSYNRDLMTDLFERDTKLQELLKTSKEYTLQDEFKKLGLDFEGKEVRTSNLPTLISSSTALSLATYGEVIHEILEQIIDHFLYHCAKKNQSSKLLQYYSPYEKYFELIATEKRKRNQISLMRYDALEPKLGKWKFLENNTHCPGGVIHCGMIKAAWLESKMGKHFSKALKHENTLIDANDSFVRQLVRAGSEISQTDHPNILLATYRGSYFNELYTIQKKHAQLVSSAEISGECFVGDIRELNCDRTGACFFRGNRIDIIYNKIDPLMIFAESKELSGWIAAGKSEKVEFLNGLGASFLTEAKRTYALLWDNEILSELKVTGLQEKIIKSVIPYTSVLTKDSGSLERALNNKDLFIVKPDALTRGAGVYIGCDQSQSLWEENVLKSVDQDYILQEFVSAPTRPANFTLNQIVPEYYGVDVFLFDGKYAGIVSRSHQNRVMNIGNGGSESVVLVYRD